MIQIIKYDSKINCEHLLGKFLDENHYDLLVDFDCDFYDVTSDITGEASEKNVIFKFRKNIFTKEEVLGAYDGLRNSTEISTNNRGMASGPRGKKNGERLWVEDYQKLVLEQISQDCLDFDLEETLNETRHSDEDSKERGHVWVRNACEKNGIQNYENLWEEIVDQLRKSDRENQKDIARKFLKCISSTTYANVVHSAILGAFDRFPRFPYGRLCNYNMDKEEIFAKAYPFFRKLDFLFKDMLPERYQIQKRCADSIDQKFRVAGDTVFTTITTNRNFRTAAHRDAGDLHEGFSNLCVVGNEKDYRGGYLVLPEFRVAINLRAGDLLLVNNHFGIHGNTEIIPPEGKDIEDMERVSVVSYFREGMLECGEYDYEQHRKLFVDTVKTDTSHKHYRDGWNGVYPFMFDTQEWKDFLLSHKDGERWLQRYHSNLIEENNLGDFF